jgi:hypothetical protein
VANDLRVSSSPDRDDAMMVDGVVVVQKDAVLPDGWRFR